MPGAGGGSNFFLAKGSKAEAAKKRKASASTNSRKGSLVKPKQKPGGKKGKTFDTGSGLKKKKKRAEDDDEEILSDASDVVGDEGAGQGPDAGYSRYE